MSRSVFPVLAALTALAGAASAQPANDGFADAVQIASPGTVSGTNTNATLEPAEAVPTCQPSHGASVWWTFTPPSDGLLSVDLGGSGFDTVLTLGQPVSSELACNDDVGFPTVTSRVANVPVAGGTPVYIRVSGYRDPAGTVSQGDVSLTLSFSSGALVTTPLPAGTTAGRPVFAHPAELGTGASGSCRLSTAGTAVPYASISFTVAAGGAYTATVDDSGTAGYDSFLLLYRSPFVPSDPCLNLLAFDDDGTAAPDDAQIAGIALEGGGAYTLVVTGFNNLDFGTYTGTLLGPGAVTFEPVASVAGPSSASSSLAVSPNPSRGSFRVRLAAEGDVTVAVYDVAGRRVATLFRGPASAGGLLDPGLGGVHLPAGVYVVRATGPTTDLAERVVVVR